MTAGADAWNVVQIAELIRASEAVLLGALRILDVDARATMPRHATWVLSAAELDDLRTMVFEHAEFAERLRLIAEQLPARELLAVYDDVAAGAAAALADGILDPTTVRLAAGALGIRQGCAALADALVSTDVRSAWSELTVAALLNAFRDVDQAVVTHLINESGVDPVLTWAAADDETIRRVVVVLRSYAEQA